MATQLGNPNEVLIAGEEIELQPQGQGAYQTITGGNGHAVTEVVIYVIGVAHRRQVDRRILRRSGFEEA